MIPHNQVIDAATVFSAFGSRQGHDNVEEIWGTQIVAV